MHDIQPRITHVGPELLDQLDQEDIIWSKYQGHDVSIRKVSGAIGKREVSSAHLI